MDNNREILVEILARLRLQDQIRSTKTASIGNPDDENFRVRFESEQEKTKQMVDAFSKIIDSQF